MKLVRFEDWRTGLEVQLPTGPHVLDVVASVRVLLRDDPVSNGLLNGILKKQGSWAPLIEHWDQVGMGLRRLVSLALSNPRHPHLVMYPADGIRLTAPSDNLRKIATLEIAELNQVAFEAAGCVPIARQAMEASIVDNVADERVVFLEAHRDRRSLLSSPKK
jgi:hypothetical protein